MQVIGSHQNRPAHASKLTRFPVSYQQMLVSLPAYTIKITRNLVNLLRMRVSYTCVNLIAYAT